jgi:hypothetical protein
VKAVDEEEEDIDDIQAEKDGLKHQNVHLDNDGGRYSFCRLSGK